MIYRWLYRIVMTLWIGFIVYVLSDHYPEVFMNPIVTAAGTGMAGALIILKPWRG